VTSVDANQSGHAAAYQLRQGAGLIKDSDDITVAIFNNKEAQSSNDDSQASDDDSQASNDDFIDPSIDPSIDSAQTPSRVAQGGGSALDRQLRMLGRLPSLPEERAVAECMPASASTTCWDGCLPRG
jgi:hypothetical protein